MTDTWDTPDGRTHFAFDGCPGGHMEYADLDALLATTTPEPAAAVSLAPGRHVHSWTVCPCGAHRDLAAPRRGRSADRLGKDQERRIQDRFGPTKIGQFGSAIDLIGRVWKWQSKSTRGDVPDWLRAIRRPLGHTPPKVVTDAEWAMRSLRPDLRPLVIQSFVKHGLPTIDRIWVRAEDWAQEHGLRLDDPSVAWEWVVMSGEWFLDVNGRDQQ